MAMGGAGRVQETIVECIREAQSSTFIDDQIQALQTLLTVTKVSPQNRNLLAQSDAAIAALLALSTSPSPVNTLALSVLFNLSLNPNLKHSLAQMDTIFLLNHLLLLSDEDSSRLSGSLLCSLAMLDKNKAKFGVAGTIQILLKAISGARSPAAHHLLSSLAELVQFQGNCTVAVREGAVPALMTVAESGSGGGEDLSGTALAILGLLVRFEEGLREVQRMDRVVARMVGILKRGCMLSKEGACDILLRLFDEGEGWLRDAAELPEFSTVLADVSVRGSGRVREKATLLMKRIMDANLY